MANFSLDIFLLSLSENLEECKIDKGNLKECKIDIGVAEGHEYESQEGRYASMSHSCPHAGITQWNKNIYQPCPYQSDKMFFLQKKTILMKDVNETWRHLLELVLFCFFLWSQHRWHRCELHSPEQDPHWANVKWFVLTYTCNVVS